MHAAVYQQAYRKYLFLLFTTKCPNFPKYAKSGLSFSTQSR